MATALDVFPDIDPNNVDPDDIAAGAAGGPLSAAQNPDTLVAQRLNSPLASVSRGNKDSGDSPLSKRLFEESDELHPDRSEVLAKRDAIMGAYKKLMDAQAYQQPVVNSPSDVALAAPTLLNDPTTSAFGQGLVESTKQKLRDQAAQQTAGVNQATTGLAGATANEGFDAKDLESQLKLLQAAALSDYRTNQLSAKDSTVVKDPITGRVIGTYNKVTQQMEPVGGGANGADANGTPEIVPVPGIAPKSPIHAGMNAVLNDQGLDPAGMINRTKADVAASIKDSQSDKAAFDAAQAAAGIAAKAQTAIKAGYAGGGAGSIASNISANLGLSPELVANRNTIDKLSGQVASQIASGMHGARIGVGMEKFLKGTTFNSDITPEANLRITQNIQDLPVVAKRNMELSALTAQLPQAYKNGVYTEFTNDNPMFIKDPTAKPDPKTHDIPEIVNPAYKDPHLVQNWFAQRAQKANGVAPAEATAPTPAAPTGAQPATEATAAPAGIVTPKTKEEYDLLPSGTPYYNINTKTVKTKP